MAQGGRVRKKSERIMLKFSFSRFKNTPDDPIMIDLDASTPKSEPKTEMADELAQNVNVSQEIVIVNANAAISGTNQVSIEHAEEVKGVDLLMSSLKIEPDEVVNEKGGKKPHTQESDVNKPAVVKEPTKRDVKNEETKIDNQSDPIIDDDDFATHYIINIESSSRQTRSATRRGHISTERGREDVKTVNKEKGTYIEIEDTSSAGSDKKKRRREENSSGLRKKRPTFANLRTRTSPKQLHKTIAGLNEKQKEDVRSIGLGPLLEMGLDGVPSKLGFFVVDRLNTRAMLLELPSGSIPITVETVHRILGLPMGGVDLTQCDDDFFGLMLTKDWRRQFTVLLVRPSNIMEAIRKQPEGGFMFKVNFVVLFVNLMAGGNSMGTINSSVIGKLKNKSMLSQIDWCKYIHERVRNSKQHWSRENDMCFYAGPLSLITLLYVDATISCRVTVRDNEKDKKKTALTVWNMGQLRKREITEIDDGGFGLLSIKEEFKFNQTCEKGESSKGASTNPTTLGKKEYMEYVELRIKYLISAKEEAEKVLGNAISKFPGDADFERLKTDLNRVLNWCKFTESHKQDNGADKVETSKNSLSMVALDDKIWDSPKFVAEVVETVQREVRKSETKRALNQFRATGLNVDDPGFDLGISPEKVTIAEGLNHFSIVAKYTYQEWNDIQPQSLPSMHVDRVTHSVQKNCSYT